MSEVSVAELLSERSRVVSDKVPERYIFRTLVEGHKEPAARIGAYCLFWSQFSERSSKGRPSLYKTDAELEKAIGKSRSTISRQIRILCRPNNGVDPVFEVARYPLPGQKTGSVRWLIVTEAGHEVLKAARQLQTSESAKSKRSKVTKGAGQMSQNATTIIHETVQKNGMKTFSKAAEKKEPLLVEEKVQVERLVRLFNESCNANNKPQMCWSTNEVNYAEHGLAEFCKKVDLAALDDSKIKRITAVWCTEYPDLISGMSAKVNAYNSAGLKASSLQFYGLQWFELAKKKLVQKATSKGNAADFFSNPANQ